MLTRKREENEMLWGSERGRGSCIALALAGVARTGWDDIITESCEAKRDDDVDLFSTMTCGEF